MYSVISSSITLELVPQNQFIRGFTFSNEVCEGEGTIRRYTHTRIVFLDDYINDTRDNASNVCPKCTPMNSLTNDLVVAHKTVLVAV